MLPPKFSRDVGVKQRKVLKAAALDKETVMFRSN